MAEAKMTDAELIAALRDGKGWPRLGQAAADRIEALRKKSITLQERAAAAEKEAARFASALQSIALYSEKLFPSKFLLQFVDMDSYRETLADGVSVIREKAKSALSRSQAKADAEEAARRLGRIAGENAAAAVIAAGLIFAAAFIGPALFWLIGQ